MSSICLCLIAFVRHSSDKVSKLEGTVEHYKKKLEDMGLLRRQVHSHMLTDVVVVMFDLGFSDCKHTASPFI